MTPQTPPCQPFDPDPNHIAASSINNNNNNNESIPLAPLCGFEGPEKRLEIQFTFDPTSPTSTSTANSPSSRCHRKLGLLLVSADQWQSQVLQRARCTIISSTCNEHFNSFVLSESSLFVYPTKVMIKTCGTTALLNAVDPILNIARDHGMSVQFMVYSRKNFVFPENQPAPHKNFDMEVAALDKYFDGAGYIIGPLTGDHWHMYIADYRQLYITSPNDHEESETELEQQQQQQQQQQQPGEAVSDSDDNDSENAVPSSIAGSPHSHISTDADDHPLTVNRVRKSGITVEVLMHDLSPAKMSQFFKKEGISAEDTTHLSKIDTILPGSVIDAFQFDPCGYSMNGLLGSAYWTIHITPEPGFSYVSFETNVTEAQLSECAGGCAGGQDSYADMLARVLHTFEPGRFTITLFSDDYNAQCEVIQQLSKVWRSKEKDFKLHNKCTTEFPEEGYVLTWCCFSQRLSSPISLKNGFATSLKRCQSALF